MTQTREQAGKNGAQDQSREQTAAAPTAEAILDMVQLTPMTDDEIDRLLREANADALGPNIVIVGFWDKAPGSVLAGMTIGREERPSTFQRGKRGEAPTMDQIIYVQGVVHYAEEVEVDGGEVIAKGTTIAGVFAYQLDTPSQMVWSRRLGSKLRARMREGLVEIGNGRQRYDYAEIRCVQPTPPRAAAARPGQRPPQGGAAAPSASA